MRIPSILTLTIATLLLSASTNAQRTTPALEWNNELAVVESTVNYGDSVLPAYTFTVFEGNRGDVLDLWRKDLTAGGAVIGKGEPFAANDVRIAELSTRPVRVITASKEDKKVGNTTVSLAFRSTDTIPAEKAKAYVRDLAVKYNRAMVEQQIAEEEKALEKAKASLGKSASKENKLKADLQKTKNELVKLEADRTKQQKKNADILGQIAGAEQKYAITNDVKDLKKLTKYRSKLADGESKVARIMEKEAKLNATANKYSGALPDSADAKEEKEKGVASHEQRIEALRSKLAKIR